MSGVLVTPAVTVSPKERMTELLDALAFGLTPPMSCSACQNLTAGPCPDCARAASDVRGVLAGIKAVQDAETEGQARAAYVACLIGLAECPT
jgi:hypothetical protein